MQSIKHRLGLSGKLVLAILSVGAIPLTTSLSVAYYRGSSDLQDVIGASFQALAESSAGKVDAELQRIITADRMLTRHAARDPEVRAKLTGNQILDNKTSMPRLDWHPIIEAESVKGALKTSWVSRSEVGHNGATPASSSTENKAAMMIRLHVDNVTQSNLLHLAIPIHDEKSSLLIGWLHREYDIKELFDPLIYPIRFGRTGHVMLINNAGTIISCPLLATGSRIADRILLADVTINPAGWTTAENDGHGSRAFSIVGYAPLAGVNSFLPLGDSWHMFAWQDSSEIFASSRSFLAGVLLAGLISMGLLVALSYYASSRIVRPIQKLRHEASLIAGGDLSHPLAVRTGDEIEELADEFDVMRIQLRRHIDTLEEKVEERTRELKNNQAEKDRVTEQLIQAEKMSAIGTMISGIGHEINNPLYVIMGAAEAIRDEKDISACNKHALDIIKNGKHISAIVKNFSGYIRPASQHELEKVDVHEKLSEALAMVKLSLLDDQIEIRQDFAPVPRIDARPEEIQQIFFNIIRNGIQAMKGKKGVLKVTTSLEDNQVCIRIQDTGTGIKTEHLGKIFDPFFTTKEPDEGEGLGMYIVRKIANKYNGFVTLASEFGKGTTVTIRLPVVNST